MQGIISFSNRIALNIKSNDHKDDILSDLSTLYKIKILQRHHHNLDNSNVNVVTTNHLMNLRSNGNRYYLYFTLYNDIETMYYIDKKIHPGYQRPRIIFGRGLFDKKLFKNTLIDGEMVKCKDNTWTFLINDIICYEGKYLNNKTLPERLNIIYNLLETQYTPDSTIDVCNFKVKCYFNMYKESIEELHKLAKNLNYTCRGIYIWPYDLKYKPKLYNYDETNVIDVVRKTKDITEFKTIENHNIEIINENNNEIKPVNPVNSLNIIDKVKEVKEVKEIKEVKENIVDTKQTHANTCNDNEKILFLMKTLEPDIYNIYETENVNDKSIGIALVQTMNDSKILRTAFRDKNAMTVLKFACIFSDKFKKWKAERQILTS
jgi:hypothetical protein